MVDRKEGRHNFIECPSCGYEFPEFCEDCEKICMDYIRSIQAGVTAVFNQNKTLIKEIRKLNEIIKKND